MSVNVSSTTDSNEAVAAAIGDLAKTQSVEEKSAPAESAEEVDKELGETAEATEALEAQAETEELDIVDESQDAKPKKKGGFQKRIDKLNKRVSAVEQEKEYWREQALRTSSQQKPTEPAPEKKVETGKPKADDFASNAEYIEALTDWKLEQKLQSEAQKQKENAVKSEQQTRMQKHQERVTKFVQAHDDWEDVIEPFGQMPLSITVQEAILNSDHGPELMYELAKTPDVLKRICSLPAISAAMELGKIEARVSKAISTTETKTSKAPAPVNPIRTGRATTPGAYSEDMSQKDYERWRNDQLKQRRA